MKEDIYYIVNIKPQYQENFRLTTIRKTFCGKLVNHNDGNFYFELNGCGAMIIIPHSWIENMAPSKVLWEIMQKKARENKYGK